MSSKIEETYLFVEKYRPKNLEDVVLPDNYKKIFKKFLDEKEIPHLLLHGPAGSGKSTMARILVDNITPDRADCLVLNGSSSTGVDVVRGHIEDFLKTPSFGGGSSIKIIFIDEFDYMSANAQAALRGITEKYHESGRFIFTCNYLTKIIDPLQSRCQMFEFRKLPLDYIFEYCKNILNKEEIKYDEVSLNKVITMLYPDMRKIINTIQSRCENGVLQIKGKDLESQEKNFRSFITDMLIGINAGDSIKTNGSIQNMLELLKETDLDYTNVYQDLFNDDSIPVWAKIQINQFANQHQGSLIPAMNIMSMCYSIIKVGKQLRELKK